MIITIDGPSGTGKSTVAKGVAKRLGATFFDTGAMYRSVAWKILQLGIDPADQKKVGEMLPHFEYRIVNTPSGERHYFVGETEVTHEIRSQKITSVSSQIAVYPVVRKTLVKIQRKFGYDTDAVFEGRDMGTVVFPDADLKIFLTARPTVRAERRYKELLAKFPEVSDTLTVAQIQKEIEERDKTDSEREISPLKQAADAVLIDTSDLSVDEVIEKIVKLKPAGLKSVPPMKWVYRICYLLMRTFFKLFFGLKIYGLEHFRRGSALIASNHLSYYDPLIVGISCPHEVHFLARRNLFEIVWLGWLIKLLNSHPVSKSSSDAHVFRLLIQLLEEGKKVIIFPEGSRSFDGELQPLERGTAFLVQKAQCRVLPVFIQGSFEAWPRTKKYPRLYGKIRVAFGSPIEWEEFSHLEKKEAQDKITNRINQSLHQLRDWLLAGAIGSPP